MDCGGRPAKLSGSEWPRWPLRTTVTCKSLLRCYSSTLALRTMIFDYSTVSHLAHLPEWPCFAKIAPAVQFIRSWFRREEYPRYKDLSWQNKRFFTTCLRKITWIFWPDRIVPTTNSWKPLRKHHWIPSWGEGDSIRSVIPRLRMETSTHARIALRCTPEGTRKRESLCCRWRRTMLNKAVMVWSAAVKNSREPGQVRDGWRNLVEALCATRHEEDEWLWVIEFYG